MSISQKSPKTAEAGLRNLIAKLAPKHQKVIGTLRRWLRKRLPTSHELVYEYKDFIVISFSPNEHGYEGVFAIHAGENGVRLYLNRGKGLPDPAKLLQGSGKQTRWIPVEAATTLALPAVKHLVEEAIERNPVPFSRSGKGALVLRSELTKKQKRLRPA